jgi:membrane protein insertase Oxa1/YidC/SpoIIIJ
LKAVKSADITGVIDYGMFAFLVHPLLASLRWMYQYVHNYGYAIILLTLLLSLLLFPLRLKQIISMKKTADKSLLFLKNVPVNWDEEINSEVVTHFLDQLAKK